MDVEIGELASLDSVSKKLKQSEEAMDDMENSTSVAGSASGSLNLHNLNGSRSDMSCEEDDNDGEDATDDDCDIYGDDGDNYMYGDDDVYSSLQEQFDNVDLPTGVEASVSWLSDPTPGSNISTHESVLVEGGMVSHSASAAAHALSIPACCKTEAIASSSSSAFAESSCNEKGKEESKVEIMKKYLDFKRFDVVDDCSDHHYNRTGFEGQQPPKEWSKKIQDEWKILEKNLPEMIYVRVYESRMDLLRAVIVGPQGTPYHDGLFVFDVLFPPSYPDIPPMVYYYSGGLRLNPNLYECGKVCLSLLNTWTGKGNENWVPNSSTMLQVLVSIQAIILNAKPFFNEPGFESTYLGAEGEKKSRSYNEDVFVSSLKTMVYTLRRPPKHFDDLVTGHFHSHAHDILSACRAYMGGAVVGSVVKGKIQDGSKKGTSSEFAASIRGMINGLVSSFTKIGAEDCEQFRCS
ncbi:putative ubiquitin-conjugating enzyme E2 38 [Olea europaea var. sylvestris]|uniref:putative ubiquitin-conjugating enzyme E2 38 n=1 Tax=Olea europaea var. sylvestris TaxID=158386 RepID=UPI000C1CDA8A|nr:putative ubiquitin-conjugating enzyme E2 38 [Olea europaea var. sylvestris]